MSSKDRKLKKIPVLKTDEEAERFVEGADLAQYDLSSFQPARFEFEKKEARLNMRLPQSLLLAIKKKAEEHNLPYQRYIRILLEEAVTTSRKTN